jgi:hypothetical protein
MDATKNDLLRGRKRFISSYLSGYLSLLCASTNTKQPRLTLPVNCLSFFLSLFPLYLPMGRWLLPPTSRGGEAKALFDQFSLCREEKEEEEEEEEDAP